MITTTRDLMVYSLADFERLPEDGMFEVVDGRAILMPGADIPHQLISAALFNALQQRLGPKARVLTTVNVFIPRPPGAVSAVQNRIPDLVVARKLPVLRFEPGNPPDLVIEILSTPRGNVERTEKLDDYALAGIGEYWIVDRFSRTCEVYSLEAGDYRREDRAPDAPLRPAAFPGVEIAPSEIWAALE